jgi:hypothetical protein
MHARVHRPFVDGLRLPSRPEVPAVWASGSRSVRVVTTASPKRHRMIPQDLSEMASGEVQLMGVMWHADEDPEDRDPHFYIGAEGNRAVSYVMLERRFRVASCSWQEYDARIWHPLPDDHGVWSVSMAWVSYNNRQMGWARRTLEAGLVHLAVRRDRLAWHEPFTDEGRLLAQSMCPDGLLIGK